MPTPEETNTLEKLHDLEDKFNRLVKAIQEDADKHGGTSYRILKAAGLGRPEPQRWGKCDPII